MRLKNIIWKTVVMSLMASPLCISCDDDDEVTVNSKFYLSTKVFPVDSYEASLSVILKDNSVVVNELQPNYRFVACATERLSKDVKITADSDDNLVSAYNKANDTEYNILPAENYSFTNKTVTIENGESVSGDSIKIELLNVGSLTTEGGYLLPVTISSIEGNNLDALSSNRGVVYVKIQNIHVNVESGQPAEGTLIADRSGWTVKVAPTTRGDAKNLIDGTNSDVARDGGAEYWLTVDIGKFKNNQWYHLAFVCDGVKLTIYVNGNIDATLDLPRKPLRLVKNSFGICNGDWMVTDAIVSEVRFWTTAISQSQIQNNMFAINPGTDGLEAYWKLNEGAGTEFKDATGHGNKAMAPNGVVRWVDGIRSDGK